MIIGIDASRAETVENTGTENYSLNLIEHLAKIDKTNLYILYSRKKLVNQLAPVHLGANFKNCVISWPILWTQIGLSLEMLFGKLDVLFIPAHVLPLIYPENSVVTIHGLEYNQCPENYTYFSRNYLRQSTIYSARRARKIIVPSENTKHDLMNFYKINRDKITVIHHGIDENIRNVAMRSTTEQQNNKEERHILFIGRLETRKNIVRLIEAFNLYKKKNLADKNLKLILAGKKGVGFNEIKKAIDRSAYNEDIITKGYISEKKKNTLLKNALVFAYPSLYEGFGLPILEAQAAGVPVLSSDIASIPEVAGNGALLVDPKNSGALAEGIKKLIADRKARRELIDNGFKNIQRFSWKKCAIKTLSILVN